MSALNQKATDLNLRFRDSTAWKVLDFGLSGLGRATIVSSFGADSAVLLHMIAQMDRNTTVLFIDTEMLFPETLAYQQDLTEYLGLTGVLLIRGGQNVVADPEKALHVDQPDICCNLRKTAPLKTALRAYDTWISGRKRVQSGTRAQLQFFEADGDLIKVNPLVFWDHNAIENYFDTHFLPRHPLVKSGYPSIGCAPCTTPVRVGEDPRAGRWRGQDRTECGIHLKDGHLTRAATNP